MNTDVLLLPGAILSSPAEAATLTFNLLPDFNGPVTPINYEVTDINGETSAAVIDITLTPTPDAVDDPFTTLEDTPVNVSPLGNDDDGAGVDSVTVDTIPDPAEGVLTYVDATGAIVPVTPGTVLTPAEAATLEFTPEPDFTGPITPIEYTLTDINGAQSSAEITVDVTPTPDAVDDAFVSNEDTPVLLDPLSNDDLGAGADSLTVNNVPDPAVEGILTYLDDAGNPVTVAAGDVLTPEQAATLTFVPVTDFNGTVPPINYTVTDINGETSDANILIEITPTPDAVDDPFTTNEDTPVNVSPLGNDDDGAGVASVTVDTIPPASEGVLTYTDASGAVVTVAPGAILTADEAATLEFTPAPDFNGPITPIDYTLTDINGATSEADILIDVTPTPDATDDAFTGIQDTPVALNPLANDDVGAGAQSVTINNVPDAASEGTLTYTDADGNTVTVAPGDVLTPEQAATLTFVPVAGFSGTVPSVGYTVTDINGVTADAVIDITILPTSSISGTVFEDANGNGIQDAGEAGIAGVEVTLVGEDINGNAVELTVLTDANGNYSFDGLVAGTYSVFQVQPEGFDDGVASSDVAGSIASNQLNNIVLGFGDNFTGNTFSEISQITGTGTGTSGRPAQFPGFLPFGSQRLNNRISNFLGGPGPIYSGVPIASNGNPLTLDSGRPVTGGYATEFASPDAIADATGDCGCPEVIQAPCDGPIVEEVTSDCDVCEQVVEEVVSETVTESECQSCQEEFSQCDNCSDCGNCCDCGTVVQKTPFLFRFKHWLQR